MESKSRELERGQSIVLFAMLFVVLAGFVGLVVDVSVIFVRQANMQNATDAAAVAAAHDLCENEELESIEASAYMFISVNGYGAHASELNVMVTVYPSPTPMPTSDVPTPMSTFTPMPSATPEGGWFETATPIPTMTPTASPDEYVEVVMERQAPLFFLRLIWPEDHVNLTVRTVAACNEYRVRIAE